MQGYKVDFPPPETSKAAEKVVHVLEGGASTLEVSFKQGIDNEQDYIKASSLCLDFLTLRIPY